MTFPILGGNTGIAAYEIANSLRFNDNDSAYLSRSISSSGSNTNSTISFWFKRASSLSSQQILFNNYKSSYYFRINLNSSSQLEIIDVTNGSVTGKRTTDMLFRDVSAYYHLMIAINGSEGSQEDRVKLYVNGNQITDWASTTSWSSTFQMNDSTQSHYIGQRGDSAQYFDGYISEFNYIDGSTKSSTDFGEFDSDSGIWKPIEYTGSYGTNGFYLKFSNSSDFGEDFSGNGNDFTPTNLASTDQTTDTPTNNFATFNSIDNPHTSPTYSEGNTKLVSQSSTYTYDVANFGLTTGKWYWEIKCTTSPDDDYFLVGISSTQPTASNQELGYFAHDWGLYGAGGVNSLRNNNAFSSYGNAITNGDIIGVALDLDNNRLYFSINGTFQNSSAPASGTNPINITAPSGTPRGVYLPAVGYLDGSNSGTFEANFGNPAFSISSGNSDGNGYGNFEYAPPSGYLALCTQNLATALSPTIDDGSENFNTLLYTGNGTNPRSLTGVGFQPDFTWIKNRTDAWGHGLADSTRGGGKTLISNSTAVEQTDYTWGYVESFDSDGFTVDNGASGDDFVNQTSDNYVSWNWKAGGTSPTKTYTVKVVSDSGNKYRFDDFGTSAVTLDLQEGGTYTFDQSDSSNSGHPLRFSTTSDGTHGSGTEYTTGVTTTGTAGSSGAKTVITVSASAPTLYYYCSSHSGMGGQANTNTTHGSSNFAGSIQSVAQANTTAGFSIVTYSGQETTGTVGHGLGVAPKMYIIKSRTSADNWKVYHEALGNDGHLNLNTTSAEITSVDLWNSTNPTSSVFTVLGNTTTVNDSGKDYVAYCFAEIEGYSKFGSYEGNGSTDGTFVYTGFRPAFVLTKRTDGVTSWRLWDSKRNSGGSVLYPNSSASEDGTSYASYVDLNSNGFKWRDSNYDNVSSGTYIYMAFAENPFVDSNAIPVTAR